METAPRRTVQRDVALVVGPVTAIGAAWLLSLGDSSTDRPLSLANATLIIATVTVLAAVADWVAGIVTSIVAALALNYFQTEPFRTLRITDRQELVSVILLAIMGLTISAAVAARARSAMRRVTVREVDASRAELRDRLDAGDVTAQIWNDAAAGVRTALGTTTVRLARSRPFDLPTISRDVGVRGGNDLIVIPRSGAVLAVKIASDTHWLVITPIETDTVTELERWILALLTETVEFLLGVDAAA